MLKIAIPKGRLFEESIKFLQEREIISKGFEEGRKLSIKVDGYEFFLVKPFDVPVYVENGVADLGIVGYDVLLERQPDLYRLYNLGIGFCKVVVAGPKESYEKYKEETYLKVATKYPRIARKFFSERGIKTHLVYLSGSVELAPLIGLSHCIVDLVQTGRTLKENNLIVYEEIAVSTAHLVCNRASYRSKRSRILELLDKIMDSVA